MAFTPVNTPLLLVAVRSANATMLQTEPFQC